LSNAFYDDPVWIIVLPEENGSKEKLPMASEFFLKYSIIYGEVYASRNKLEGIASSYLTIKQR
jgi:hypothetical protein